MHISAAGDKSTQNQQEASDHILNQSNSGVD